MILLALKSGWPDRLVSESHDGPVPDGHIAFDSFAAMDEWKSAHPELMPQPESQAEPVPESVTLRQFLMQADRTGLLLALENLKVNEAVPLQTRRDLHFFLEYSNLIDRYHPLISQLAPIVGVTDAQVDDLFQAAAQL